MLIDQVFIFLDFICQSRQIMPNHSDWFKITACQRRSKFDLFSTVFSFKETFFVKRETFRHDEIFIFWIVLWKQALWWPVNKQLIGLEAKRDLIPRFQNLQKLHIRNDWIMWHEKIFLASKFILDSLLYKKCWQNQHFFD